MTSRNVSQLREKLQDNLGVNLHSLEGLADLIVLVYRSVSSINQRLQKLETKVDGAIANVIKQAAVVANVPEESAFRTTTTPLPTAKL